MFRSKITTLILLAVVSTLIVEVTNADFIFGEPVNLKEVIPVIDLIDELINCFSSDGLEIYLAIRAGDPHVVVIIMTAHPKELSDLVDKAIHYSVYSCLYKPLDTPRVIELVDEVWAQKQKAM